MVVLRPVNSAQRHAWVATVVLLMAMGGGAAAVWGSLHEEKLTTEKSLVQAAQQVPARHDVCEFAALFGGVLFT